VRFTSIESMQLTYRCLVKNLVKLAKSEPVVRKSLVGSV